jgi:opacity protein-like surface antigen
MRTKVSLAALLAATCLTTPVLAADLYTKAPPPVAAPIPYADWSGVYVGLEAGYGWGHNSFDQFNSPGGFGGAGNIANILTGQSSVLFPDFTGVGPFNRVNTQGWLAGGFAGAQKQWGSWVFGIEADFNAADIHGSLSASRVSNGDVSLFSMSPAQVFSSGVATVAPVTVDSTGTAFVQRRPVDITGPIQLCTNGTNLCGPILAPGTVVTAGTVIGIQQTKNNINVGGGVAAPGEIKLVLQNNVTVGADGIATVRLPFFSVPGQDAFVSVSGTVPGQLAPVSTSGFTTNDVLQRFDLQNLAIHRTMSVDTKIDEIGSVRGKIGFVPSQNWLLYATGGMAWAHATTTTTATEFFDVAFDEGTQRFSHSVRASGAGTMLGWALGAGVDWKMPIDQGSSFVLGLEYLHYEFPKNTISLADGGFSTNFVSNNQSVDAVKGRISYLFSIH